MTASGLWLGVGVGTVLTATAFVLAWKLSVRAKVIDIAAEQVRNGANDPQIPPALRPHVALIFTLLAGGFRTALEQQLP